ncbi:hypothetical protein [Nostoc sp. CENA543]|uniref:hypothetical protein n=1 Tax=Nostoc sp. CENA543 TaxID=1869241 RepID=UPI001CEFA12B|nr:hypothetical protein [Nostoc sp. CENA543]
MLRRLIEWIKGFFQGLFGKKSTAAKVNREISTEPAPPLTDTDLEFLFTELLEGVHQARGETWALRWLQNIEHRITTERWIQWLKQFGEKLLAASSPNNELASRLVQLGELNIGEIGDVAYDIGMQILTRNQGEPIWEYDGPDADSTNIPQTPDSSTPEEFPEGEFQTVTLDELFVMLQQDENLRKQMAAQLAIETDDPQVIVETLVNQYYAASQSAAE